jgi:myo-inositol 2-dehydrogenase / D-chiro-inositol 1-dehydrogenase
VISGARARPRVGVIGTGFMGETHLAAWAAEGVPIVVLGRDRVRGDALAADLGAASAGSLDELLGSVEIVDICTPTDEHAPLALAAAGAGRHVICEKPLARTIEQAEGMIRACAAEGVMLLVAHVVRFFPEYEAAHRLVAGGEIGEAAVLRLKRASSRPPRSGGWLFDHARSGGLIVDLMIHDFDFATWIAGSVVSVHARSAGVDRPDLGVEHAVALLEHAGGAISHVSGSWAYAPPTFRTAFEISGSHGLVEFDSEASPPVAWYLHPTGTETARPKGLPSSPMAEDPYRLELRELYGSIVDGTRARVSARDGLEALRIALAADESARTGRVVPIAAAAGAGVP